MTNVSEVEGSRGTRCHALLIEADEPYRAAIAACMRLAGCRVDQVDGIEPSFLLLERRSFDLMVWGVSRADGDRRVEVMSELRLGSEAPLIVVGADTTTAQGSWSRWTTVLPAEPPGQGYCMTFSKPNAGAPAQRQA